MGEKAETEEINKGENIFLQHCRHMLTTFRLKLATQQREAKYCPLQPKFKWRLNQILKVESAVQISKLAKLLPEGFPIEISVYGRVSPNWQHVVSNDWYPRRYHLLSADGNVFMHASVSAYVHTRVYNYGSPSTKRETFHFGTAICWNIPFTIHLSVITMQERMEQKKTFRKIKLKMKEQDKWHLAD